VAHAGADAGQFEQDAGDEQDASAQRDAGAMLADGGGETCHGDACLDAAHVPDGSKRGALLGGGACSVQTGAQNRESGVLLLLLGCALWLRRRARRV
jgi:hypothetical protein